MNLAIVPLNPKHSDNWDAICEKSSDAWFWHTSNWHEYTLAYNPALESRSCSFLLCDKSNPVAAVPLLIERYQHGETTIFEFSFGGGWLPSPVCIDSLSPKQKKKVLQVAFDHIFALAREKNVVRIRYRSNTFAHIQSDISQLIPTAIQYGFAAHLVATQIIDVTSSPTDILKGMRKGHRSDIKRAEKKLESLVISSQNVSPDSFAAYRQLHTKASNGQTRPAATFEMMYDWIKKGKAVLFGATLNDVPISFAYVIIYKDCAHYSSACNDPEIQNLPLAHFVQWQILKWLHANNYHWYEIGRQYYSPTEILPVSNKEIAISNFKRGFGGVTVPTVLSEKFFSRNSYIFLNRMQVEKFSETFPESAADFIN